MVERRGARRIGGGKHEGAVVRYDDIDFTAEISDGIDMLAEAVACVTTLTADQAYGPIRDCINRLIEEHAPKEER